MTAKNIWFVRHGESLANAGGITSVASRVPLTERGEEQAKAVAKAIPVKPSIIITSPYDRAKDTAFPINERWPDIELIEWPVQEFVYLSWQRLGPSTAAEREKAAIPYWNQMDPDFQDGDDAESYTGLLQRIDRTIDLIKELQSVNTVVVSHKLFLSVLFYRLVNQHPIPPGMEEMRKFLLEYKIPNGAITHYTFDQNGEAQMEKMMIEHLKGKAAPRSNSGL